MIDGIHLQDILEYIIRMASIRYFEFMIC